MTNNIINEYNSNISFYKEVIDKFDADIPYYRALIDTLRPKKIIEVGCGSGRLFPTYLQFDLEEITGIDISDEMINVARKKFPETTLICKDILEIDFNEKYDLIIISNSMLKHIDTNKRRLEILKKLKSILDVNGVISIDHAPYLYYEDKNTDWIDAGSSVVSEWIPDTGLVLKNYQWKKVINQNTDSVIWRYILDGIVHYELKFSTYIYDFKDLYQHVNALQLKYIEILSNYPYVKSDVDHMRFIGIIGNNEEMMKDISQQVITKLK